VVRERREDFTTELAEESRGNGEERKRGSNREKRKRRKGGKTRPPRKAAATKESEGHDVSCPYRR
jgi:hypothetical protein